jgi:hypothetical protein
MGCQQSVQTSTFNDVISDKNNSDEPKSQSDSVKQDVNSNRNNSEEPKSQKRLEELHTKMDNIIKQTVSTNQRVVNAVLPTSTTDPIDVVTVDPIDVVTVNAIDDVTVLPAIDNAKRLEEETVKADQVLQESTTKSTIVTTPQFRRQPPLPSRIPCSTAAKSLRKREEYREAMFEVLLADADEVILAAKQGRRPLPIDVDSIVANVRARARSLSQTPNLSFSSTPPTTSLVPPVQTAQSPIPMSQKKLKKKLNTSRIPTGNRMR